jgi:hypothetical protein
VPMGREAVRVVGEGRNAESTRKTRMLAVKSASNLIDLPAPNGAVVARLEIRYPDAGLEVAKHEQMILPIGSASLKLTNPEALHPDGRFFIRPLPLPLPIVINGSRPKDWSYTVRATYDGSRFVAMVGQLSSSLRAPAADLLEGEELLISAPHEKVDLAVTQEQHYAEAVLTGRFVWRDIRKGK